MDTRAEIIFISYKTDKCKDALIKAIENNKKGLSIDELTKAINKKDTCVEKKTSNSFLKAKIQS